jgi:hypothetical protein
MVNLEEAVCSGAFAAHAPERAAMVVSPMESSLDVSYEDPITKRNLKEWGLTFRDLEEIFSEFEIE